MRPPPDLGPDFRQFAGAVIGAILFWSAILYGLRALLDRPS